MVGIEAEEVAVGEAPVVGVVVDEEARGKALFKTVTSLSRELHVLSYTCNSPKTTRYPEETGFFRDRICHLVEAFLKPADGGTSKSPPLSWTGHST